MKNKNFRLSCILGLMMVIVSACSSNKGDGCGYWSAEEKINTLELRKEIACEKTYFKYDDRVSE